MRTISLFILVFGFNILSSAQGIEFYKGSWDEALVKAVEEEKLIFVDAYAKWCGPCKRMSKNVFTNPAVGEYYNTNFINLKLDMEEAESQDFKKFFSVSAFPTLFYIDGQGELVKKVVGGMQIKDFINLGKDVLKSYDRSGIYAEAYEKGDRGYDLVLKYIKSLNKADKPSQKVANDFLRDNADLSKDELATFLHESVVAADSRLFDLYVSNLSNVRKVYNEREVNAKLEAACWATVYNAVEFEVEELLFEAQSKYEKVLPKTAKSFNLESEYEYYKGIDNAELMAENALTMSKKLHKKNAALLNHISEELIEVSRDRQVLFDASEKLAKMAVDLDKKNEEYLLTLAKVLYKNNKSAEALKFAKKSLELCVEKNLPNEEVKQLIEDIQSM